MSLPVAGVMRIEPQNGDTFDVAVDAIRISPRLGSTSRILGLPSGGHVECEDSPDLDAWLPRRNGIEVVADWLERRWMAALCAALGTVLGVLLFFKVGLPWVADRIATQVPATFERSIGAQTMILLDHTALKPSRLPLARQQSLQVQFHTLVASLPRVGVMQLELRDSPSIGPNAFALPGGEIVMTDHLVALAGSDAELIAVLAHETGHHVHRHALRMALENGGVAAMAGFLFGDVSGTGALSVSIPVLLLNNGYSRTHEREADRFAINLLRQRGRSPRALADMLRRLEAVSGEGLSGRVSYLSTHPPSADRIEIAERAAALDERRPR